MPRLALALTLSLAAPATAADWPQFRGSDRYGVSPETGLPTTWDHSTNVAWKTDLPGPGTSSPVFVGNKSS